MLKPVEFHSHFTLDCNLDYEVAELAPAPNSTLIKSHLILSKEALQQPTITHMSLSGKKKKGNLQLFYSIKDSVVEKRSISY